MGCGRNFDSSSSGHGFSNKGCICDVVRAIKDIQDAATDNECAGCQSCFMEPLGGMVNPSRHQADTRVFMLLTKDGTPFKAFFRHFDRFDNGHGHGGDKDKKDKHDDKKESCFSIFFRVEEIFDGCCATLRVLVPFDRKDDEVNLIDKDGKLDLNEICNVRDFRLSNSCVTVDLNCFCGIECVADVFLGVCD
ncbi:CotY/CotZ family spore coat protein [Paenisporosarcina indica]|uniref:CotY/CotZ family spore coat protein n=1 Tax=Paenisporosarcina indica TaxID=650093 RepID=UPI00094FCF3E|nr:CotY/CotZ family spore coat protein [Paenisporosarcina indica]